MTETKIKRSIIILIGLTVLILIGMVLGWLIVLMRPQQEKIAAVQKEYNERKTEADKLPGNLVAQRAAEDKQRYVEGQLAFFRGDAQSRWQGRYRTFVFSELGDPASETPEQKALRIGVWRRQLREYFSEYGEALRATLIRAANATDDPRDGKKFVLSTSVKVDAPPKAPEDVTVPPNALMKPTGATGGGALSVTVTGSFNEIKNFFTRINREPILFNISNVKLAGVSPNIATSFTITPYLLATGPGAKVNVAAPAPAEGAPSSEGGAGAGGGSTQTTTNAPR
ncbi:MAG TPA: hypothetical protein VF681_06110 [Abditibacteriaceae bacterium]|jgi:hypothetical protein